MKIIFDGDLFKRQTALLWQTNEIVSNLKTSYYGNFYIWKRRDSYSRCSIDFMLSGFKT